MTKTPEQFCVSEAIKMAKDLSYRDCLQFLRGLVLLAGDAAEAQPLREVMASMMEDDQQLELIAAGEGK